MKKFYLSALLAMLPAVLWAQFSLSGTVTDNSSGKILAGATLTLNGAMSVQSNASGSFLFKNLRKGGYVLKVGYVGYSTYQSTLTINGDKVLPVILKASSFLSDEVVVTATRAGANSATTYRNLSKEELAKNNLGQDLPFLLNQTPSAVVTSDAGAGVGYTGIRIRGSDPTRVNVTINGIPYNDTESQGTYFVDLPDFASSVDNIQVQRGVGTSTNGAGAFGGSINIQTNTRRDSAYADLDNTFGSFTTWKHMLNMGTGMLNNHFTVDGRLSTIRSEGYIDRSGSRLKSYFLSGAYYGKKDLLRANLFSGTEKTNLAWNGVPEALLETDRTFNGFHYDGETDNYTQDHYQLLYSHTFNPVFSFSSALHFTHGKGYYEEYKEDQQFSDYAIRPTTVGAVTYTSGDLVRQLWLDNDFYGATWSLNYAPENKKLQFTLGGAYNHYDGDHNGYVLWAQHTLDLVYNQNYYYGIGQKADFNTFGKAVYQLGKVALTADLQFRHTGYTITGMDDHRNRQDQDAYLNFFNPKAGITYNLNETDNLYASFAVANKEPNRDDYINSTLINRPKPENLKDLEAGYRFKRSTFEAGLNGFGMFYKDQLISTGKINDVGEYIRQNVPVSYRMGAELDGKAALTNRLNLALTASLSRNRVKNFTSFDDDYDNGGQIVTNFKTTDLAFSPSFIASGELDFTPFKHAGIALLSKYVSHQYLDNTSNEGRTIDAFFVNDVRLKYSFSTRTIKNAGLTLLVNNVLNEKYESNGYTFSYLYSGTYTTENYYYPQAPANFLLGLSVGF